LSLGASGAIGKSVVFFPWKGLDVAREYVVPANPKTDAQNTQRGYVTNAVANIHAAMQTAVSPLDEDDKTAYALWGSTFPTPRTWFNQIVKMLVDLAVAGKSAVIFTNGTTTPGAAQLGVAVTRKIGSPTAGVFFYGTTKACTSGYVDGVLAAEEFTATIPNLTAGVKYYWQFRASEPAGCVGGESGVYYGTPT